MAKHSQKPAATPSSESDSSKSQSAPEAQSAPEVQSAPEAQSAPEVQSAPEARKTCDISDWAKAQYIAHVGLANVEGGTRFKRFVKTFPAQSEDPSHVYPSSGRERVLGGFTTLKFRYPIGSDGYSCLAMAAEVDGVSAHFGYAYWRRGQETEVPEYICISPTFDSRDGEYRRRFIRGPVFLESYERLASDLIPYEEAVLAMVGGPLRLASTAYPETAAKGIITQASDLRLPVLAFTVALMLDLWETQHGLLMAHTSNAYVTLLTKVSKMWPSLLRGRLSGTRISSLFRRGSTDLFAVQCGQKLVPMYTREVMQPLDYNLAAWRELAVTRLVGDLVLNCVSPSFALYNQWTYIEGADASLFENKAMAERYVRGSAVDVAMRPLREARRLLSGAEQNYHTEELSARFYESLEYAQSYLHMSPIALAHTMEDVGWSMQSLSSYVRFASDQWPAAVEAFADPDTAARHLFELAYAAHCLHTKTGIAHTDLHTNNMTFYMWGLADVQHKVETNGASTYTPYYDDPFVAYVAGPRGEADTYVFPGAGDSACIIDYSRCILGPAFRRRLEEGRSPQYATNFYRDQVNRVMRAFHRYAPEYVAAHQDAIKAAVLANFEVAFPVLCAVDFIAIGANIGELLLDAAQPLVDEVRPFMVAHEASALALLLEEAGRELLITGLHDLAESAGARREMNTPKPPGDTVLERVFGEWLFPRWAARAPGRIRTAQLVDAYNYNNDMDRYSGSDYAKYPPWGRLDEIERHLGEYKMTDLFERGVEPFLAALRPGARVEVIAEQIRARQEKLDGKPVSAASSWIDE
jgi:hypothetical protein